MFTRSTPEEFMIGSETEEVGLKTFYVNITKISG